MLAVPNTGNERATLSFYIEQEMTESGHIVIPTRQAGKPTDYCRNLTVDTFLNSPGGRQCDWFYTIDSDTVPPFIGSNKVPEGTLNRLLSHHFADPAKKVICGVTFSVSRGVNWMPAMHAHSSGQWSPDRHVYKQDSYPLVSVDGIGAACMLVHRDVIEAVMGYHGVCFKDRYNDVGQRVLGQDLDFCRKVRERGYQIWCDMSVVCSHYKTVDIKEYTESMLEHIKIFRMISTALDGYFGSLEEASEKLFGTGTTLSGLQEFVNEGTSADEGAVTLPGAETASQELPANGPGPEEAPDEERLLAGVDFDSIDARIHLDGADVRQ